MIWTLERYAKEIVKLTGGSWEYSENGFIITNPDIRVISPYIHEDPKRYAARVLDRFRKLKAIADEVISIKGGKITSMDTQYCIITHDDGSVTPLQSYISDRFFPEIAVKMLNKIRSEKETFIHEVSGAFYLEKREEGICVEYVGNDGCIHKAGDNVSMKRYSTLSAAKVARKRLILDRKVWE